MRDRQTEWQWENGGGRERWGKRGGGNSSKHWGDSTKSWRHRGFRAANHPTTSANQSLTINIPRENPEQRPPCFPHGLKCSNGANDGLIPNKNPQNWSWHTFTDDKIYQLHLSNVSCIPPEVNTCSTTWWSDWKPLVRKEAGLWAQRGSQAPSLGPAFVLQPLP